MKRAFTIIEVIVIVVILGIIATLIVPRLFQRIGQSRTGLAEANAASLANQVSAYSIDHGKPGPGSTIDILWERPQGVAADQWEPYVQSPDALIDPWGEKFVLRVPGEKNFDFDVVSYGSDKQPGGTGDAADIVKP
jgi:general secretion pathway protein G